MALLSLSDFQTLYLGGATSDADVQQQVLDGMEDAVLRWLGYPPTSTGTRTAETATYVQVEDSPFSPLRGRGWIRLQVAPVQSITSLKIVSDGDFTGATAESSSDYRLTRPDSFKDPRLTLTGVTLSDSEEAEVTYVAGHDPVPDGLAHAFGELCAWAILLRERRGEASQSSSGTVTKSYRPEEWPPDLKATLAEYKLPGARA